jgi:hypothetical protein
MRKLILGLVLALAAGLPAYAQQQQQGPSPEDIAAKRDKETLDRQYQNAIKNAQPTVVQTKSDPWATMRAPTAAAEPKR